MKLNLLNTLLRRKAALATVAIAAMAATAYASPVTITNGSFSQGSHSSQELSEGSYSGAHVTGWSNASGAYNFLFTSPTAAAPDQYGTFRDPDSVSLYHVTSSPDGGHFLALDSDYGQGAISQTINGLIVGDLVTINFDFAGAQQVGYSGASTDLLAVTLGDQTLNTQTLSDASHGFTGWYSESLTFTATDTSELLSFFAVGTPTGVPSFALLDGVSASQVLPPASPVPEPESLVLLATGLLGLGGIVRSRFSK